MIICFERIIVTNTVLAKICKLSESMNVQDSGVACRSPGCALRSRTKSLESCTLQTNIGTESVYELKSEQGDDVARELYILPFYRLS